MKRLCGHADFDPIVHADTCRVCHLCAKDPNYAMIYECPIPNRPDLKWVPPDEKGLGTLLEQTLTAVGITKERVERWIGQSCHCDERKRRLNRFTAWAKYKLGLGPEPPHEELPPPEVIS